MKPIQNKIRLLILVIFAIALINSNISAQILSDSSGRFLGGSNGSEIYKNFNKYWNQITPGNAGKWGSVENIQGSYNWTILDNIYNYAVQNGIIFKEHVLVWGNQEPSWVATLDSAGQRAAVEKWFEEVGKRYPEMALVDVVNEPFHAVPSYKNALGGDGVTGWDWIITSFELARKYMPAGAKLLLNEYSVLHSNTVTTNYLNIINLLKERNLIDGIAIQGHYFEFRSDISSTSKYIYDINTIKNNLKKFTDTGIPVYISEFDIDEPVDANQLEQYKIYFPIFWNNPGVVGITFWGYVETDVWNSHPNTFLVKADGRGRPAWDWLKNYITLPLIPEPASPITGTTSRNPYLVWKSSKGATSYKVQVSSSNRFTSFIIDSVVSDTTIQVDSLSANTRYYWRVAAINDNGQGDFSPVSVFLTTDVFVSVNEQSYALGEFKLNQNYPNPFNPSTRISYSIPNSCAVSLKVFNLLGKEVAVLVEDYQEQGDYSVMYDAGMLPSGIYFYQIKAGSYSDTKKLLLIK